MLMPNPEISTAFINHFVTNHIERISQTNVLVPIRATILPHLSNNMFKMQFLHCLGTLEWR